MPMRKSCVPLLVLLLAGFSSLSSAQTPLTPEIEVSAEGPSVTLLPLTAAMNARGEFVVTWPGRRPGSSEVTLLARWFAADGTPGSGPVVVSEENSSLYPSAGEIREDGSFLVVYEVTGPDGLARLKGRLFAPDGAPLGDAFPVTDGSARVVAVASREDGGFVVAWESERHRISYRLLAPGGERVGPERSLGIGSWVAVAAGPGNEMVVVWVDWNPSNSILEAVAGQRLRPDGGRRGGKFLVNKRRFSQGILPKVGIDDDGNFLVVWSDRDVRARRYGKDGAVRSKVRRIAAGVTMSGFAMDRLGDFTLVWPHFGDSSGTNNLARRFRRDGSPLGPAVLTGASDSYWYPAMAGNEAGNFVVVSPDDTRILARVFSPE